MPLGIAFRLSLIERGAVDSFQSGIQLSEGRTGKPSLLSSELYSMLYQLILIL